VQCSSLTVRWQLPRWHHSDCDPRVVTIWLTDTGLHSADDASARGAPALRARRFALAAGLGSNIVALARARGSAAAMGNGPPPLCSGGGASPASQAQVTVPRQCARAMMSSAWYCRWLSWKQRSDLPQKICTAPRRQWKLTLTWRHSWPGSASGWPSWSTAPPPWNASCAHAPPTPWYTYIVMAQPASQPASQLQRFSVDRSKLWLPNSRRPCTGR
jgi:hypothetical protein